CGTIIDEKPKRVRGSINCNSKRERSIETAIREALKRNTRKSTWRVHATNSLKIMVCRIPLHASDLVDGGVGRPIGIKRRRQLGVRDAADGKFRGGYAPICELCGGNRAIEEFWCRHGAVKKF